MSSQKNPPVDEITLKTAKNPIFLLLNINLLQHNQPEA